MSNSIYPANIRGLTWTSMKTPEWKTLQQTAANGYQVRIPQMSNPIWHFTLVYDYLYSNSRSGNNIVPYAPYSDFDTLLGFFNARKGQFDDFLFFDPTDYTASGIRTGVWQAGRSYALGSVVIDFNGHAQLATTGGISGAGYPSFSMTGGTTSDGSIVWTDQGYFPTGWPNAPMTLSLVQDAGGNYYSPIQRSMGSAFVEDITDLVPNTLNVFANGSPQVSGVNYQVLGPGLAVPGTAYMGLYLKWITMPAQPVTATFQFYFRVDFETDTQDFEQWAQGLWTIGGSKSKNGSGYLKLVTSRPTPAF